jgi:hypothetical protein
MGFGALITAGPNHAAMDAAVMRWIVEARVEMELSKASRFALRFEEDICHGNPEVANRPELQADQMIGIFVSLQGTPHCLVVGPITRIRSSSMVGGTGSWLEVHGEDRRVEMGYVAIQDVWTGRASTAAATILSSYGFTADVEETRIDYSDAQHTLNQRGTDLAFVEDIARKNNLEFWLTYPASAGPGGVRLDEICAHLKSSPSRPSGGPPAAPILLADGESSHAIDIQPPPGQCVTVTKFDARIDFERPNAARGFAQALDTPNPQKNDSTPPDEPVNPAADPIGRLQRESRQALAPTVTDPVEQELAAQAQLTEAAWFVEVDCSTTLELIKFLVLPHQIIDVRHAGARLSGPYQVKSAIHVINAADHFIDFKLRANGLAATGVSP